MESQEKEALMKSGQQPPLAHNLIHQRVVAYSFHKGNYLDVFILLYHSVAYLLDQWMH